MPHTNRNYTTKLVLKTAKGDEMCCDPVLVTLFNNHLVLKHGLFTQEKMNCKSVNLCRLIGVKYGFTSFIFIQEL